MECPRCEGTRLNEFPCYFGMKKETYVQCLDCTKVWRKEDAKTETIQP